ncbi:MAG: 3,4-dihydroxy-2-butanone-4-phosphate synthase [Solirubrobacterales bacterium]
MRAPAQVLVPDEDRVIPHAAFAEWPRRLGGAPIVHIAGQTHPTAHLLIVQEPQAIAACRRACAGRGGGVGASAARWPTCATSAWSCWSTRRGASEGYLVGAARTITPPLVNAMLLDAGGTPWWRWRVALPRAGHRAARRRADSGPRFAFMVSIEARHGVTTGVSAADRARTMIAADRGRVRPTSRCRATSCRCAAEAGVLARAAAPEAAAVDLTRLAGLDGGGAMRHILDEDGQVALARRGPALARRRGLAVVTTGDVVDERRRREPLVQRAVGRAAVHTVVGPALATTYREPGGPEHIALVVGERGGLDAPLHTTSAGRSTTGLHSRRARALPLRRLAGDRPGGILLYLAPGTDAPGGRADRRAGARRPRPGRGRRARGLTPRREEATMDRILTTHVGSLVRPPELVELLRARDDGR